MSIKTALNEQLGICSACHKLQPVDQTRAQECIRCGAIFYARKPRSLEYTIAWTIAAIVMFIPANLAPMMSFNTLGVSDPSTILGGIKVFIQLGMLPVAIIVFIASFIVPLSKVLGLITLIIGVKFKSKITPSQRTKIYHIVEFLGPWSMLDVFVVAIMAAVVDLGFLTTIDAGSGVTYFALMVLFTMFAAESFDPRLIWDNENNGKH